MLSPSTTERAGHRHDGREIQDALNRIGEHLRKPARLVLIGSCVGMWYGQPGRFTEDIDVWSPRSEVDLADIKQACEKAGVTFNPTEFDKPEGLYLQMVTPGIVHVGRYRNDVAMYTTGNLTVVHPPAQHIVASKLVRGTASDLEDAIFLMSRCALTMESVGAAIATLPAASRQAAEENLVLLEIHQTALAEAGEFAARKNKSPLPAAGARRRAP
jgi:hypothetical protein